MSVASLQRLTLFALLSAIEDDIKGAITTNLEPDKKIATLYESFSVKKATERFQKDLNNVIESSELAILDYFDLGDHIHTIQRYASNFNASSTRSIQVHSSRLNDIIAVRNRVMHGRPLDFTDLPRVRDLARDLSRSDAALWRKTQETFQRLREDPAYALSFEDDFEVEPVDKIFHNLPSPDFDDTGFVGRQEQLTKLKKAILGAFPVITVLGEGGYGKTSLCLKAIYELIGDLQNKFDAIVWTTAKANILTNRDVVEINGAIRDSLGIFRAAASVLDSSDISPSVDVIIKWMQEFRIFLIIDNLETILDENIRSFASEVPLGSKVVFTSRVGLGAYDFPIIVPQLSPQEAVDYFRRVCDVFSLNEMTSRKSEYIQGVCSRLVFNPLAIKWFVQSVKSGGRADELLADPKLVLRYCVENVIDKLSAEARHVLNVFVTTARAQSIAAIHYITQQEFAQLSNCIRELRAANLISVIPATEIAGDDSYIITQLANLYVRNYFAPAQEEQDLIRARQRELISLREAPVRESNSYNQNYIFVRPGHDDHISADYLRKCLSQLRSSHFPAAEEYLRKSKEMSPNYFEVYRVEGFLAFLIDNILRAEDAYERAVTLKPDHAPLRRWYGGFLLRIDEAERAVDEFREAVAIDPAESVLRFELAKAYTKLRDYDRARQEMGLIDETKLNFKERKQILNGWLAIFNGEFDTAISAGKLNEAYGAVTDLRVYIDSVQGSLIDAKHISSFTRLSTSLARFNSEERGGSRGAEAMQVREKVMHLITHFSQSGRTE